MAEFSERQFDIYFNKNKMRSFLGFDGFDEDEPGVVFLCTASPEEIDTEIYMRERVNCESRFAFENLGIDRLDEIFSMFQKSTDLFKAAAAGNEIKVQDLLAAGADPNYQDDDGKTPLMVAAKNGYESRFGVVELLVNAGADIFIFDNNDWQALDYANEVASEESWRPYIAEFLKEKMYPTNLSDKVSSAYEISGLKVTSVTNKNEVDLGR